MPTKLDNKPINNSHRGLRVKINDADISGGKRLRPDACAAANALCRMQGVQNAKVYRHCIYLQDEKGNWNRYRTSGALRLETIVFDRGGRFLPGEYDLLPVPISEIIGKNKKKRQRIAAPKSQRGGFGDNRRQNQERHRMFIPGTRPTANGIRG